jgi:hypothetical protein
MTSVFASYARTDEVLVRPLVRLLSAALQPDEGEMWPSRSLVFLDQDSLIPGKPWRAQIDAAILDCSKMMVFWCEHTSTSTEVGREIAVALSLRKPVVPVLIDSCPLSEELASLHAVDVRRLNLHVVGPESPYKLLKARAQTSTSSFSDALAFDFATLFDLDAAQFSLRIERAWTQSIA